MPPTRCTCCHICHASFKTSKRLFVACNGCPNVICQVCLTAHGLEEESNWDNVVADTTWTCPRCDGNCPCKRCRAKVQNAEAKKSLKRASSNNSPGNTSTRPKRTQVIRSNSYNEIEIAETLVSTRSQSRTGTKRKSPDKCNVASSAVEMEDQIDTPSTSPNSGKIDFDCTQLRAKSTMQRKFNELWNKNEKCLNYIMCTERLLEMIHSEQQKVASELMELSKEMELKLPRGISKNNKENTSFNAKRQRISY